MRDQQRARTGIEERARQSRQGLGAGLVACDGVAGRQHNPIRIELELGDFTRGEQTVVELRGLIGNGERERGLTQSLDVAGNEAVGGKVDDAVLSKRCTLERRFAGVAAEMNIGLGRPDIPGHRVQLVGGVGQLRQRLRKPRAIDAGTAPEIAIGNGRDAARGDLAARGAPLGGRLPVRD